MNTINTKYYSPLFLIVILLLSTQEMCHAVEAITISQIFRDNGSTLISSGGNFELGFFTQENPKNRYVGIWYKKITKQTVVWVANRDNPLTDGTGMLRVVEPGILTLVNGTDIVIWSTNTSRTVQTPVAILLDSGNLIVKDANDDDGNFLWQSFSYPTDTLLPGMKLGVNFVTGKEVYITSPKNSGDPASGDFTYHCDPSGYPQYVIKRGSAVRFKSGPWNGVRFSGIPNLNQNKFYKFGVVINNNEAYYYYELINDSLITRFTLSENGVGQRWIWDNPSWTLYLSIPDNYCDNYNSCGAYGICNENTCTCLNKFEPKDPQGWNGGDRSSGCVRSTPFKCGEGDAFLIYSGIKLPDTQYSSYNTSLSLVECRELCSRNCSCTAYTSLDISRGGSGCLLWFNDLVNMRNLRTGQDIYIRMSSSELDNSTHSGRRSDNSTHSGRRRREILIVILSLVTGISLLSLTLWLYCMRRKKSDHQLPEPGRPILSYVDNHPDESHDEDMELPLFELSTISKATNNFSMENKLGEGGFGPVYRGVLDNGLEIAAKRLSRTSHQGVNEFKTEVACIGKLQHRNLVKLLGCCIHGEEKMLVYEYMINKSLDLILFDPSKSTLLDWSRRSNIINGIARGLVYLHEDSRLRVIHRDLKASNILLDFDMNPKISDFGLARTFGGNETGADTSRIVGTYGYMSPEYAVEGLFSVKSDVFSFGVLVLEILSGKRNRGFSHRDHRLNLLGHAWLLYKEEKSLELVDSCLMNSCDLSKVQRSIHIGLLCVQESPEDRPNMSSVVQMLSNNGILPEAKHPGFFTGRDIVSTKTSGSSNTASSTYTMTITQLEAR